MLKGVEFAEFTLTPNGAEGTPTPPDDGQGFTNIDDDDDPPVSDLVTQVTVPIELYFLGSGLRTNLRALLDLGCTRCLINPAMVEKLGIQLRQLKVIVAFCQ